MLPFANQLPATAQQLGLAPEDVDLPVVIINDGRVIQRNLKMRGLNEEWLGKRLAEHRVKRTQDVYLLTVDGNNRVYFAAREQCG